MNNENQGTQGTQGTAPRSMNSDDRWDERLLKAREEANEKAELRQTQLIEMIDEVAVGQARFVTDFTDTAKKVRELHQKTVGIEPTTFVQKTNAVVREVADVVTPYFVVGASMLALGKGASSAYAGTRDWWRRRQAAKNPVTVMPITEG